jgi:hypothetical protein
VAVTVIVSASFVLLVIVAWPRSRRRRSSERAVEDPAPTSPAAIENPALHALRNETELSHAYQSLRERPSIVRVQAIWAAQYPTINIDEYLRHEREFLLDNPQVSLERIVAGHQHHLAYFQDLTRTCQNLAIFTSSTTLQFELYLCEYSAPQHHMAGVLAFISPLSRIPELGILLDSEYGYTLRDWFESIPKTAVTPDEFEDVWDKNANDYDALVSRQAKLTFLREFIVREDELLAELIARMSQNVALVEFGSGTGRTIEHLIDSPELAEKLSVIVGIDNAPRMLEVARGKRERRLTLDQRGRIFYLELDGSHAERVFWNGRALLGRVSDEGQPKNVPFPQEIYERGDRVICCLLNTLGVLDATTRAALVSSMLTAATANDYLVLSVFAQSAFSEHAGPLYRHISKLVGSRTIPDSAFDDRLAEFRSGAYFSHWFKEDELRSLVEGAGGYVERAETITSGERTIGHFVVVRKSTEPF